MQALRSKKDNVIQPLTIVLSSIEKKKTLSKSRTCRSKLLTVKYRNLLEKLAHVDLDLTKVQRIKENPLQTLQLPSKLSYRKNFLF